MKTAKVIELGQVKPWEGSHGTVFYCQCVMDNGDKIEIGKKKPVELGWELTYELTGDEGQYEFTKAKAVNPEKVEFSAPSTKNNGTVNDSILYQVCLKGVMEYYTATHNPSFESSFTAESINDFALKIAQKAKENISKL